MSEQTKITGWEFERIIDIPRKEMKTFYDKVLNLFDKYPEVHESDIDLLKRAHEEYGEQSTETDKTFIAVAFALRKHNDDR